MEREGVFTVELPVSSLTSRQLKDQLEVRGMKGVGSRSAMQQLLESVLSSSGFKRKRVSKGGSEAATKLNIVHLQNDIDTYISASTAPITLSNFLALLSIIREPSVFGDAHLLAVSSLAHNFWSTMGLNCETSQENFLSLFEESDEDIQSLPCDLDGMEMKLSDIALHPDRVLLMKRADACIAEKLQFLQVEMSMVYHRTSPRPAALKLQEYPKLLQPLKDSADPPISSLLPFLVALRNAGVVDGTLGCGASPTERAEADRLEVLFVSWVDRHPWVQEFL